ncbi:hypothetical protein TIFTF001_025081 [Ficus carica]|uniref:Uncharacterized protein n=1 Tax=Ficus carica TaxID=3494 RepID=A0AA88DKH6_FICCA|nr:hypothetical protein TIFTF001_025081 [Ficus carica]
MHSLIDVIGGLAIGLVILAFWLTVNEYVDSFVVSGQNVTTFWGALSFLLLFAYPTPEFPTPSFEFHTAFTGVALGIVTGVQQQYHQFHHEAVPRVFTPQLLIPAFVGRMLVGIPTILVVKFCSKALAKWALPIVSNTLGIPIRSTSYIPTLGKSGNGKNSKKSDEFKQAGYIQKLFFFSNQEAFDVDTEVNDFKPSESEGRGGVVSWHPSFSLLCQPKRSSGLNLGYSHQADGQGTFFPPQSRTRGKILPTDLTVDIVFDSFKKRSHAPISTGTSNRLAWARYLHCELANCPHETGKSAFDCTKKTEMKLSELIKKTSCNRMPKVVHSRYELKQSNHISNFTCVYTTIQAKQTAVHVKCPFTTGTWLWERDIIIEAIT